MEELEVYEIEMISGGRTSVWKWAAVYEFVASGWGDFWEGVKDGYNN